MILMTVLTSNGSEFIVNLAESNARFCLRSHYSGDESYLYVSKTQIQICKIKGIDNIRLVCFV